MQAILEEYLPNVMEIPDEFIEATQETIYMTVYTSLIAGVLGLFFGILLVVTRPGGILEQRVFFNILDQIVNIVRSIPFIILLALLVTVTRFIVGTSIGATAALVPLIVGVVPFYARQVEVALLEVDPGVVEAAEAMGTSPIGIIFRVYLLEGLPGIIRVSALSIINVISLTAMAGAVGAGGLGNLAVTRGYNRFQTDVTWVALIIILIVVFISQAISNWLIKKVSH
ncbi:methionine ABC transporter permease [Tetragenococcus halophilus]|uniref:Methionine ABC transporter permease protein n=2 Tax=Tetragenococcus halophilus TaxID=51669 RepID=A0A2H6D6Y4_TETHA|nr:methionine ABC transporter permease [Tetragenococcus halophilus]AYW49037.1 ABC transporter permease [Tetragenococcus halophilus]MCO8284806.1 ABC transporter permease [Tetragenococcus halophilus]MCO8294311.1 ABC transporter permease [Tetragenococcus halophilus]NWO00586.1 ABC transporter permease [Tetragenococcus halophilus]QGP76846.1 ABC transporter permease subunit [Tetragenococcus halophilus]